MGTLLSTTMTESETLLSSSLEAAVGRSLRNPLRVLRFLEEYTRNLSTARALFIVQPFSLSFNHITYITYAICGLETVGVVSCQYIMLVANLYKKDTKVGFLLTFS